MKRGGTCIALLIIVLASVNAQEFVSWSTPKNLGFDRQYPLIGALPDGKLAIVSFVGSSFGGPSLTLGIYDNNGNLLSELAVDTGFYLRIDPPSNPFPSGGRPGPLAAMITSHDGKITIFYKKYDGALYFKQYASDGTLLIDRTEVASASSDLDVMDVTVTTNGEIHTLYRLAVFPNSRLFYRRFSPSGTSIGQPVEIVSSFGPKVLEGSMAAYTANSVAIGYIVVWSGNYLTPTRVYARKIIDGVVGTEMYVAEPEGSTCGYVYPGPGGLSTCLYRGLSVAVRGTDMYFVYWYIIYKIQHGGAPLWTEQPRWQRVSLEGGPGSAFNSFSSYNVNYYDDLIMLTRIIVDSRGRKWIAWIDRREYGKTSNMRLELLGPNDETLVNDGIITHTRDEEYFHAAVDSMDNLHIAFVNGFRKKREAESQLPTLYHTSSTASIISTSGDSSPGGNAFIDLSNPANPNKPYLFFASFNQGATPLGNGLVIPVHLDAAFFLSITNPNLFRFSGTQGTMDSSGNARALFNPRTDAPPGTILYGGFVVYDTNGIRHISQPKRMIIKSGGG